MFRPFQERRPGLKPGLFSLSNAPIDDFGLAEVHFGENFFA